MERFERGEKITRRPGKASGQLPEGAEYILTSQSQNSLRGVANSGRETRWEPGRRHSTVSGFRGLASLGRGRSLVENAVFKGAAREKGAVLTCLHPKAALSTPKSHALSTRRARGAV